MILRRVKNRRSQWGLRPFALGLTITASLALVVSTDRCHAARGYGAASIGSVELDVRSYYSHIRVRRNGNVRTMVFVRDTGEEALETQVDFGRPHELHFDYLKYMFLSYAFRPKHENVLIVGLGGGSMVHFLKHYDPEVKVDAVEIDPTVVAIADRYFGVRSSGNVNVVTADAFDFLEKTETQYDVIYMDAFLRPSRATDSTGAPLNLRTIRFYQDIQEKVKPGGLVVFNLNPHRRIRDDLNTIREAFPQCYQFSLPGSKGMVVVASVSADREPATALSETAREVDRRFRASFSLEQMLRRLVK
jgi:spermidine synthase